MSDSGQVFVDLMAVIAERKTHPPPRSYTTSLFAAGFEKIGAKILEEAQEVVDAASEGDSEAARQHLTHEAADLIYHLFVIMGYRGISLEEVSDELAKRFGTSGLDEKAARRTSSKKNVRDK